MLRAFGEVGASQSMLRGMEVLHQELGDIFRLPIPGFNPVMVVGPEWARYIYTTGSREFLWRVESDPVTQLLRGGVLVEDRDVHDKLRRHLDPSLHRQLLNSYAETFVRRTDQIADEWQPGHRVDMLVEMRRIALLILVETLFGEDFSDQLDILWPDIMRLLKFISPGTWVVWPGIPRQGYWRARHAVDEYLYTLISAKRASPTVGDNMISRLIQAGLDDETIRDQALTMLIAGHDTSTSLLAWTLYLLDSHPEFTTQVRAEIDSKLEGRSPGIEHLDELQLLRHAIDESLRLYPPIHLSNRIAAEDIEFSDYQIPAGTRVMLSIYLTQRDPRYWPDPERFDPSRFARTSVSSRTPYSFIPFGGGKRNCIGSAFAKAEASIVLARLIQRFEFTPVHHKVRLHMGATLEPRPGVSMVPVPRSRLTRNPRPVSEVVA